MRPDSVPPPTSRRAKPEPSLDEMRTKPRTVWLLSDAREIHRVASRIGLVGPTQDPERTPDILSDLEMSLHRDPDTRLRLLRDIADNACFADTEPACIRCPLKDACLYNRELREERRQKTQNPIRRLWRGK